jgi:hypothetical protein
MLSQTAGRVKKENYQDKGEFENGFSEEQATVCVISRKSAYNAMQMEKPYKAKMDIIITLAHM